MAMEHITVYKGTDYHSAFPHIIRLQNGDLVVVFRQAPVRPGVPSRGVANEKVNHNHVDDRSRIAIVRSTDDGRTWDPESHVVVDSSDGTQDFNMGMIAQLSSGEMIMNNHRWFVNVDVERAESMRAERKVLSLPGGDRQFGAVVSDSLYMYRSSDLGRTWDTGQPFQISSLGFQAHTGKDGILEMPDGTLLLMFNSRAAIDDEWGGGVYVARSYDSGRTWVQPSQVANDPEGRVSFGEPPIVRLSSGRLLTMMRTNEYLYQAHSDDDGWVWKGVRRSPIWGFPCNLVQLKSGRVLCAYGYRREPFGVRACISDDEGETWNIGREIVIRDDGLHRDLGYPASILLQDGRILTVYYFHGEDGIRFIGGSIYAEDQR